MKFRTIKTGLYKSAPFESSHVKMEVFATIILQLPLLNHSKIMIAIGLFFGMFLQYVFVVCIKGIHSRIKWFSTGGAGIRFPEEALNRNSFSIRSRLSAQRYGFPLKRTIERTLFPEANMSL